MRMLKAIKFAKKAHEGQRRKYTHQSYYEHCLAVARTVASIGESMDTIIAALLHDTVEDNETIEIIHIVENFGEKVGQLVYEVTDQSKKSDGNRKIRKEIDRQHLAKASSSGQTIKLADLIDNTRSIEVYDPDFAKIYMKEKRALLEVLIHGNEDLMDTARRIVDGYFKRNGK